MKRFLPAALLLLAAPAAVRAQTAPAVETSTAAVAASTQAAKVPVPHPDATDWFAGPLAPHLMAWDMDERGLTRYPFDPQDGYLNGAGAQVWVRLGHQFTEGRREANTLEAGVRVAERLSGDFELSRYHIGAFNETHKPYWMTLHAVADLSQDDLNTYEYGFGFAGLFGDKPHVGPGFELRYERRLSKPWSLYAKYAPAFLTDGRFWHEASVGIGPNYRNFGADVSYKVLLNGQRDSYGPDLSLRLWF